MPDLSPGDAQRFPMGNYLIYYRVLPGKILISRVLHGKRAQRRAFRQKT
jgi:plasmid stabilization system protein ParE